MLSCDNLGLLHGKSKPTLPLVDKNIFNGRPESLLKDGVWIQVEPYAAQPRAVHDAVMEQEKIDRIVESKEAKLRQFQADVRKRVTRISRAQREMVTKTQSETMKEEQEILYKSVAAAENLTPRKNRCSYNVNQVTIDASGKLMANFKHEPRKGLGSCALMQQSNEIQKQHRSARENLAQRCITKSSNTVKPNEEDEAHLADETLPGGLWGTGPSRDKSARILLPSKLENCDDPKVDDEDHPQTISAVLAPCDIAIAAVQESIASSPIIKSKIKRDTESITSDLPTVLSLEMKDDHADNVDDEYISAPASALTPSSVYFKSNTKGEWKKQEVVPCDASPPNVVAITRLGTNFQRDQNVTFKSHRCHSGETKRSVYPVAAPGVVEHQKRKMEERNRLLSRRVFSDMERERVREERRRRDHRNKVEKLRAEKEAERRLSEKQLDDRVHAAEIERQQQKMESEMREQRKIKRQQEKMDKKKKAERFATALKARIQEKLELNNITLPPLCCCSTSFWGTNPTTCANNCLFYKNMDAYTAALQSVLTTMERGMASSCRHDKTHDHSVISLLMSKES